MKRSSEAGLVVAPASFGQCGLWIQYLTDPQDVAYNLTTALRIAGDLNIQALMSSIAAISDRHEALRTTLSELDKDLRQIVHPSLEVEFTVTSAEHLGQVEKFVKVISQKPFNLNRGPLFRAALLSIGVQKHLLILTMHHCIADGWSFGIFAKELQVIYKAYQTGSKSFELPHPLQYREHVQRERERLQGAGLQKALRYWSEHLESAPGHLRLPFQRLELAEGTRGTGEVRFGLDVHETDDLRGFCRKERMTLFMTLLATFQTLLFRYTGEEDIVICTPTSGRNHTDTHLTIGFFMNLVLVRGDLSGGPTFRQLLQRTRRTLLGVYDYQDFPFYKLIEHLPKERPVRGIPFTSICFSLQNFPRPEWTLHGMEVSREDIDSAVPRFSVDFSLKDTPEGLTAKIIYDSKLFPAECMQRMAEHYKRVLLSGLREPDREIATLPFVDSAEREFVIARWNMVSKVGPRDLCIHELFETQANRTPAAPALLDGDTLVTYGELNARAEELADALLGLGIGPESIVGVCLGRTSLMVVALLGILKSGGCYLPLDPEYPPDRIAFMLDDSRTNVLVTTHEISCRFPTHTGRTVHLPLDRVGTTIPVKRPQVFPHNAAYMIYTSGSTGKPKGVVVEHRNVVNFFDGVTPFVDDQQSVRTWLAITTISFDISVLELLWTLSRGYKVILHQTAEGMLSPLVLANQVRAHHVSHLQCTPSLASVLAEFPDFLDCLKCVRKLMLGGEVLSATLATKLRNAFPGELMNMYGPTETCVWSSVQRVDEMVGETVPIGRPILNTEFYVLDPDLEPMPIGIPGELYIAGDGVTRQYLGRPALTAERFLPNPYSKTGGARFYRTGDKARYLSDGTVEFLGRTDRQRKVRGHRIELGEVEHVLRTCPDVANGVVDTIPNGTLVAWVVPHYKAKDETTICEDLRAYLRDCVPQSMIPTTIVILEKLPLLPNGKVNLEALLNGLEPKIKQPSGRSRPLTDTERALTAIWCEVLELQVAPQVDDDFFTLGGHSLKALMVISRVSSELAAELSLREMLEFPTVSSLSARIDNALLKEIDRHDSIPIGPREGSPFPLSFQQQHALLTEAYRKPNAASRTQPQVRLALRLEGEFEAGAVEGCVNEIIRRHEILRTSYFPQLQIGPLRVEGWNTVRAFIAKHHVRRESLTFHQIIHPNSRLEVSVIGVTGSAEAEVQRSIEFMVSKEFDLSATPLLRVWILKVGPNDHRLLTIMPHVASDGWSMNVFAREFLDLYTNRHASSFSMPHPVQYAEFAQYQKVLLKKTRQKIIEGHEKGKYGYDFLKASSLPFARHDGQRLPAPSHSMTNEASMNFSQEYSLRIRKLCRNTRVTVAMFLFACFSIVLHRSSGIVKFGITIIQANRTQKEFEQTIGFIAGGQMVRVDLSADPQIRNLLEQIRAEFSEATDRHVMVDRSDAELADPAHFRIGFELIMPLNLKPILGLSVARFRMLPSREAEFALKLIVTNETDSVVRAALEFCSDCFTLPAIDSTLLSLRRIAEGAVSSLETRVSMCVP